MKHPGRKLYHLLGGCGLLAVWFVLRPPGAWAAYAALLVLVLLFDAARLGLPRFNRWCMARFSAFLRPGEAAGLTGTPAYVAGVGATFALFAEPVATAAVLFLVVGDVSATTVGEAWGRTKVRGKSLEGTGAFVTAAFAAGLGARALLGGPALPVIAAGAASAAIVELLLPRWANDNLAVPLAAAAFMTLLEKAL